MEHFRKKLGITLSLILFFGIILFNWYLHLNHQRIYTDKIKNYLNQDQKIKIFGVTNAHMYDAYYSKNIVYLEKRSNIPFIWTTTVLKETENKLYTTSY